MTSEAKNQSTTADQAESKKGRFKQYGLKRVVVLIVFVLILTGIGIVLRLLSLAPTESSALENYPPQIIRVFTTDPNAGVKITLVVESWNNSSATEALFLRVTGHGVTSNTGVLIMSDEPQDAPGSKDAQYDHFQPAHVRYGDHLNKIAEPHWYSYSTTVGHLSAYRDLFGKGWDVGDFKIPNATQVYRGRFFVHLPSLADSESSYYPLPSVMTETGGPIKGAAQDLITFPVAKNQNKVYITNSVSRQAQDYKGLPRTYGHQLYWQPSSISSEEDLWNAGDQIADSHIDTDQPTDGQLKDGTLIWQDSGSLEAQFSSSKEAKLSSESRWNFYSGIVFGVAAAGLLAIVQELPDRIRLPIRRARRQ